MPTAAGDGHVAIVAGWWPFAGWFRAPETDIDATKGQEAERETAKDARSAKTEPTMTTDARGDK